MLEPFYFALGLVNSVLLISIFLIRKIILIFCKELDGYISY